jgi:DNA-binding NarL/FixJ family response regulator
VLVIDDHPIVATSCAALALQMGATSVLDARRLADGFRLYRQQKPDLILLDLAIRTRALAGLSFIRRLGAFDPATPILVLSLHGDPLIASEALRAGANGYVRKDAPIEEIGRAIARIREGKHYLSHELGSQIAFMEARRRTTNPMRDLSARELQILSQFVEGKSYGQIAANLLVSYKSVANTFTRLKKRLGARSLPDLMRIAVQHMPSTFDRRLPSLADLETEESLATKPVSPGK